VRQVALSLRLRLPSGDEEGGVEATGSGGRHGWVNRLGWRSTAKISINSQRRQREGRTVPKAVFSLLVLGYIMLCSTNKKKKYIAQVCRVVSCVFRTIYEPVSNTMRPREPDKAGDEERTATRRWQYTLMTG
jgi:hypothetical protein